MANTVNFKIQLEVDGKQHVVNAAADIGNLLGKAMQGQTEALQRVGISFNEAQKERLMKVLERERVVAMESQHAVK